MAKRALLIGCPYGDLAGPVPDVKRLAKQLAGFDIQQCVDEATRDRILHAYRSLIDATGSGDAVVIYYSGHGAHSLDEDYTPPNEYAPPKRYHQFIVPMDIGDTTEGDFRGILNLELSSLLYQLTAKTKNVSVIFDCCHSGGMTRDLRLRPRALPKEWFAGASNHFNRLKRGEISAFPQQSIAVEGNPYAVRLMAAQPSQLAWEYESAQAGAYGLMTNAFLTALQESTSRPVTWDAIKRRVRELVQQLEPGQYPDVEGPSRRFLFELEEADLTGIIPIDVSNHQPRLQGGRLLGIGVGDEYVVMPAGYQKIDNEHTMARATVTQVGGAWAMVALDPNSAKLSAGAQAFPVRRTHQRRAVAVNVGAKFRAAIEDAINKSGFLRLASDDTATEAADTLATLTEREGRLHITEQDDRDLVDPLPPSNDVAATVTENLERLARARRLETLEAGTGDSKLTEQYEIDWGRVVGGVPVPLAPTGAVIFVGDRIFVRVRNSSGAKLYVSVFDIGIAGKITLLTKHRSNSGVELNPKGAPFAFGYHEAQGWTGIGPITWPKDVPRDGRPRPESLVVVISNVSQDLTALESPGMAAPKGQEATRSNLERIADQVATGRTRDLEADSPLPDVRYAVEHISFLVDATDSAIQTPVVVTQQRATTRSIDPGVDAIRTERVPAAAVPDRAAFLIDERPQLSAAYRRPRGVVVPAAVAVQLGEVIVHSNRALFSTDVRVDALVNTGTKDMDAVYRAGTAKFQRIKDGDRLPLDNLLLYHGPAVGFVDLAVWVSRDDKRSLSLADMIKGQLGTAEFKEAALLLVGLAVAAPTAGAIVAGLGAATTVSNIAYKLLSAAVGKSIGLYRTSLLASERFGVGRHPAAGVMRAQDFSFWYQVSEV